MASCIRTLLHDALVPVGKLLALESETSGRALSFGAYGSDGDLDLLVADYVGSHLYPQQDGSGTLAFRRSSRDRAEQTRCGGVCFALVSGGWTDPAPPGPVPASAAGARCRRGFTSDWGLRPGWTTLRVLWPDRRESVRADIEVNQKLRLAYPVRVTSIWESPSGLAARLRAVAE